MEAMQFMFNLDVAMSNKFDQSMRVLNSEFSKLGETAARVQASMGNISSYQRLSEAVKTSSTRLEYLRSCYQTSSQSVENARARTTQLAAQYDAAHKRVQQWSQSMSKNSMQLMFAKKREQELLAAYKQSQKETTTLTRERDKLYRQVGEASAKLDREKASLQEMGSALNQAGINTDNLSAHQEKLQNALEKTQAAQKKLASIRETLTWGNIKADIMKSFALFKMFEQPIRVNMDFEQAMAQVRAVLNPTREEFEALEAQAKRLGRETQFSATQASNSQENLARAGFSVEKILNMMPEVLNVAASDGMELSQAADILGGALRGFNLDSSDAQRISDILAYVSAHSATNVANAGAALQGLSGTAYLQKISPETAAAYIGVLANRANLQGQEAATTLERSISALAMRKGDAGKTLDKFGVATRVKGGGMRYLEDIVQDLYDKTTKLGTMEQQAVFMRVFGKAYGGQMLKFVQGIKSGELTEMQQGLANDKTGSAAQMALTRNDTLKGDLTALSSAWEGLMIRIGEAIAPINRFVTQTLTTGIQKVTAFMTEHETLCDVVLKVGYAFATWKVASTIGTYGKAILSLPGALMQTMSAARQAGQVMQSFGLVTKANTAIQWLWNAALDANPIGLIIIAITALIAAAAALYYYWDDIKAWGGAAAQWCLDKWHAFVDWLNSLTIDDVFAVLKNFASVVVDKIKALFSAFWEWLCNIDWSTVWDGIVEAAKICVRLITAPYRAFWNWLLNLDWSGVWDGIKKAASFCCDWLMTPFTKFSEWLCSFDWSNIWQGMKDSALKFCEWVKAPFIALADWIMEKIGKLNPFNWELPSWLQNGKPNISTEQIDSGKAAIRSRNGGSLDMRPSYMHAEGGIFSRPHIGMVAEAGPEAIIPLSDQSRGLPLLMQAARSLGVSLSPSPVSTTPSIRELNNDVNNYRISEGSSSVVNNSYALNRPPVNITINANGTDDSTARSIADEVRRVLDDLMNYDERVAFA